MCCLSARSCTPGMHACSNREDDVEHSEDHERASLVAGSDSASRSLAERRLFVP